MIKLQQNRYLWVHFAGLAFVPLLLDICLSGLASAGPALPFQGQFWVIALLTIPPALTMQWRKPFYVFSLPPVALKPAVLSNDQRRCLQIFKSWQIKALAISIALFSIWVLAQLYAMTPLISPLLQPKAGLVCATITFFLATTFMQIAVSAARALLISPEALQRVAAVEEGAIASDFLILGIRVNKLFLDTPTQVDPESNQSIPDSSRQSPSTQFATEPDTDQKPDTSKPEQLTATATAEPKKQEPQEPELKAQEAKEKTQDCKEQEPEEQEAEEVASEETEPPQPVDKPEQSMEEPLAATTQSATDNEEKERELEVVIPEPIPPEEVDDLPR